MQTQNAKPFVDPVAQNFLDALAQGGGPPIYTMSVQDARAVLRDEGEAYAKRLAEAGVPVTAMRYLGMIHDFAMLNALSSSTATRSAIGQAVAAIKDALR